MYEILHFTGHESHWLNGQLYIPSVGGVDGEVKYVFATVRLCIGVYCPESFYAKEIDNLRVYMH